MPRCRVLGGGWPRRSGRPGRVRSSGRRREWQQRRAIPARPRPAGSVPRLNAEGVAVCRWSTGCAGGVARGRPKWWLRPHPGPGPDWRGLGLAQALLLTRLSRVLSGAIGAGAAAVVLGRFLFLLRLRSALGRSLTDLRPLVQVLLRPLGGGVDGSYASVPTCSTVGWGCGCLLLAGQADEVVLVVQVASFSWAGTAGCAARWMVSGLCGTAGAVGS